jgi:hypothetical protein
MLELSSIMLDTLTEKSYGMQTWKQKQRKGNMTCIRQ